MNGQRVKRPLPLGWRWARLGEVCEFKYGEGLPEARRLLGGIPVYGSNGVVGYHSVSISAGEALIVGRKGSIGEVHHSPGPCWPIDTTYYIDRSSLKGAFELLWVYFALKWLRLDVLNKATGVPGLNREDAYKQLVPVPPAHEQRRIAARLSEQMATVEKARQAAEAQVEAANALPAAFLRQVFESEEARDWPRVRLGDVCGRPQYGYTAASARERVGPKLLRITDIQEGRVNWDAVPYCRCSPVEKKKFALQPGDLLFARSGATTGKSFLVEDLPGDAIFASYLIRVKVGQALLPKFVYTFFQSDLYWRQVGVGMRGGAQPNMNATLLAQVVLPLPPRDDQERLLAPLGSDFEFADRALQAAEAQLDALNACPGALLEDVFGGFEPPP